MRYIFAAIAIICILATQTATAFAASSLVLNDALHENGAIVIIHTFTRDTSEKMPAQMLRRYWLKNPATGEVLQSSLLSSSKVAVDNESKVTTITLTSDTRKKLTTRVQIDIEYVGLTEGAGGALVSKSLAFASKIDIVKVVNNTVAKPATKAPAAKPEAKPAAKAPVATSGKESSGTTAQQSTKGATTTTNAATAEKLLPLSAWYTYEKVGEETDATVSWKPVAGAIYYVITRTTSGKTGSVKVSGTQSIKLNDDTYKANFDSLEATDAFTVQAIQVDSDNKETIIAQGTAKEAGVVRAQTEFGSVANIGDYAQRVMKYALPLGITLGILATIYAGITLMLSQGSPEKIKDAQEAIQGAVFGLIILILTRVLVDFLFIPSIQVKPNQPNFTVPTTTKQRSV